MTFGLVKNDDGQWRISSAPDGTVLPSDRFASIFAQYELYFFDPSFRFLVPDLRWFRKGETAPDTVVDAMLAGPSTRLGDGSLFSAFPSGTARDVDRKIVMSAGVATVPLSSNVNSGSNTAHRRMQQQLLQTLRSVSALRDVDMTVNDVVVQVPGGGAVPDSAYLVASDPIGAFDGHFGVLGAGGDVTAISGIGRSADAVGATAGSIVSGDTPAIALLSPAGVTLVSAGKPPVVVDGRAGLIAPSLDPFGYAWSVPAGSPSELIATGRDGTPHAVTGLPADGRVISLDVSRDGARCSSRCRRGPDLG